MPGIPQGRDINESGAKSVTLVTIAGDRSVRIEERVTSVAQFEPVPVDLTGIADWRDMIAAVTQNLQCVRSSVRSEHLVARLRLTGTTPLAWRIRRDRDLLRTEAADRAFVIGKSWIEKIEIDCHAPDAAAGIATDPITELRRLIADEVVGSDAYQAEVAAIADELRLQLPPDCRSLLGVDEAAFRTVVAEAVKEGAEDILARLHSGAAAEVA
jgi:hypothetical protein